MLFFWIIIFIASLIVLIKGADWFLASAEKIGLSIGLSPFIIGVTIVALGTSLPELISALIAVSKGVTEIVAANAIGSNIANILLVVGVSSILAKKLVASKSLIDLDAPLLAISTVLVLGVLADKKVVFIESLFLVFLYLVYLAYTIIHREEKKEIQDKKFLPSRLERRKHFFSFLPLRKIFQEKDIGLKDIVLLVVGGICLFFGAQYLIDSIVQLSLLFNITAGVISLTAVALGTSLPELVVSGKAALKGKPEVALGNIFGSNVFNILVVIGFPGLFSTLFLDQQTFRLGLPALGLVTLLFIISIISQKIHIWEGIMYLFLYVFFVLKLFSLI